MPKRKTVGDYLMEGKGGMYDRMFCSKKGGLYEIKVVTEDKPDERTGAVIILKDGKILTRELADCLDDKEIFAEEIFCL